MIKINKFIWVELPEIDRLGKWLKVIKEEDNQFLCESGDPFTPDKWVGKEDVLKITDEEIF